MGLSILLYSLTWDDLTAMMHAANILISILRNAWAVLTGMMVAVAVLAMLFQILRLSGSAAVGAALYVNRAIGSITSLIVVVLYAFLAIPVLVHSISSYSTTDGCGPAADLGAAAAYVIVAIAAVRLAKSAFVSMLSAMAGSGDGVSFAITEGLEAVVGVVLASVAVPARPPILAWLSRNAASRRPGP